MRDTIYRDEAIGAIEELIKARLYWLGDLLSREERKGLDAALCAIVDLPSAQPEIIRCKDCKWRDENCRKVSVRWLPCMDVRTGGNWFCGSAERKPDE